MIHTRAQAKESVAEVWHQRRRTQQQTSAVASSTNRNPTTTNSSRPSQKQPPREASFISTPKASSSSEKDASPNVLKLPKGLPSLCTLIQKAWDRTGLVGKSQHHHQQQQQQERESRLHKPDDSKSTTTSKKQQQVFPSILPILQAHVLAQQVEFLHDDDAVVQDALLAVFARDYDFDKAVRQMTQTRSRAFWLIDLAAPIRRLVQWQKTYPPQVRFLYRLSANADAILLRVLARLERTGVVVKSNWDLTTAAAIITTTTSQSHAKEEESPLYLYDDTTSTHRPDGYLRRAILGGGGGGQQQQQLLRVLTVDGPAEVDRIVQAVQRLVARKQQSPPPRVKFLLRLPATAAEWSQLTTDTQERIHAVGAELAGISVDLSSSSSSDSLEQCQSALETLLTTTLLHQTNLRVDITGLDWENSDWWWQRLPQLPNVQEVTVDATEPLIGTSGALCTRIIGCKIMSDQRRHYYIDDGCYGSLYQSRDTRPLPLGRKPQKPLSLSSPSEKDDSTTTTYMSTVWGPTCDGLDRVCPNVELPDLRRDDWLVFPKISGTSGQGLGTAFNGFCPPDTVYCVLGYFK
eukprot:scaffold42088_cov191-Amphora_coffeaeformis.AAC.3